MDSISSYRTGKWVSFATMVRIACLVIGLVLSACGCSSTSTGPEIITIPASRYSEAFDASLATSRDHNMPAQLRDRRAGVIETDDRIAGSALEPWRTDNASLQQAAENTLSFQRRRARFEFTPEGFHPSDELPGGVLTGPDSAGAGSGSRGQESQPDLTKATSDLELRVWVYVERANSPGLRRSSWTRSQTSVTKLLVPEGEIGKEAATYWVPITRDRAYERRLLAAVQELLQTAPSPDK